MTFPALFAVLLLTGLVTPSSSSHPLILIGGEKLQYGNFVKHEHKVLNGKALEVHKVSKVSVCGFKCVSHERCASYNVAAVSDSSGNFECQLLAVDKHMEPAGFKYSSGFNHYGMTSPCESSPCQNGATCRADHKTRTYTCRCMPGFYDTNCQKHVTSCNDLMTIGQAKNGVYTIIPDEQGPLQVYCDQTTDNGGWAVFQRRVSPFEMSFNRTWKQYQAGFGNLTGEFWLGNDNIHRLTTKRASFRVDFHKGNDQSYSKYENFTVAGAENQYLWYMDSFSGTLLNGIYGPSQATYRLRGMKFSTPDEDNDNFPTGNCAAERHSGWWFNYCGLADLNRPVGPVWSRSKNDSMTGSGSEMKIRYPFGANFTRYELKEYFDSAKGHYGLLPIAGRPCDRCDH